MNRRGFFKGAAASTAMLPAVLIGTRTEPKTLAPNVVDDDGYVTIIGTGSVAILDSMIEAPKGITIDTTAGDVMLRGCMVEVGRGATAALTVQRGQNIALTHNEFRRHDP